MATPRQIHHPQTPTERLIETLGLLERFAIRRRNAERDEVIGLRLAAVSGASLRQMAEATGRSEDDVVRLQRRASAPGEPT